jgi:hypothetical protein
MKRDGINVLGAQTGPFNLPQCGLGVSPPRNSISSLHQVPTSATRAIHDSQCHCRKS